MTLTSTPFTFLAASTAALTTAALLFCGAARAQPAPRLCWEPWVGEGWAVAVPRGWHVRLEGGGVIATDADPPAATLSIERMPAPADAPDAVELADRFLHRLPGARTLQRFATSWDHATVTATSL